jgi:hypothetical protein
VGDIQSRFILRGVLSAGVSVEVLGEEDRRRARLLSQAGKDAAGEEGERMRCGGGFIHFHFHVISWFVVRFFTDGN